MRKLIASERGAAIISAIYVMVILTIMGFGVMALSTNEGRMIAGERKSSQALTIAESGAEQMAHRFALGVTNGGVTPDYINAAVDMSIVQALKQGKYLAYDVVDSGDNVIGKAKIVVQGTPSPNQKRISSQGQFCLDPACTNLSQPRIVQSVVALSPAESANLTAAFDNLIYTGGGSGLLWFREMWFQGNIYSQQGTTIEYDHEVKLEGTVRAHGSVTNNMCLGDYASSTVYSFGAIDKLCYQTEDDFYNSGQHDGNFPEVTIDAPLDRNWYKQYADKYFPSDAKTNPTASGNWIFCADVTGGIYHDNGTGTCSTSNPADRLLDPAGEPLRSGIVFVAGNIRISGMMSGNITFVSAGPNSGTTFGDTTITGHLYSKDTSTGMGTPSCSTERSAVSGGTDVIGLIARRVYLGDGGSCLNVRAAIRAVTGLRDPGDSSDPPRMLRLTDKKFYFRGAMVWESPSAQRWEGEYTASPNYSWRFYQDAQVSENLPPGMAGGTGAGGQAMTVTKRSFSEIYLR